MNSSFTRGAARLITAGILSLVAQVGVAHAQATRSDGAAADALFESAKRAMAAGDVDRACAQFAESQRLDPAPGTLLNLADCREKQGKLATALAAFEDARARLSAGDFRQGFATQRIDALRPRVPRLVLHFPHAPPADTKITRDEVTLGLATIDVPLPVDPGRHTVVVRAPGRSDRVVEVAVAEGEQRRVELEEGPLQPLGARELPPPHAGSRKTLGVVLLSVGGAAIVAAAVSGVMMLDAASTYRDHCPDQHCVDDVGRSAAQTGRITQIVTPVAFALGAAGGALGVYFLTADGGPRPTGAGAGTSPRGVAFSLTRAF